MSTVTLRWDDPENAAEFRRIRADLRRLGRIGDASAEVLQELVMASDVVREDGSEEGSGDDA